MKVAVVYYSGTGNTLEMANEVVSKVNESGNEAVLLTASEFTSVDGYDAFAFGCPAMGAEVLEESEFQPMWDSVKGSLSSKKVGLFGSYGWGDGEWMRNWVADAKDNGAIVINDGVICLQAMDEDTKNNLDELALELVK